MAPHALNSAGVEDNRNRLWITGLAGQYPPYFLRTDKLEKLAGRFYDAKSEGLQKLLEISRNTGIETRASIRTFEHGFGTQREPPTIVDIDEFFREHGVDLTTQACKKAIREAGVDRDAITHTIGVTCTNQGNPGYDLLVHRKLGLGPGVDRMLLHGVGCAGGLAIMRAASNVALAATIRGKPACVLAFACELCTPNARCDLAAAEKSSAADVGIAGALFADGAAAFILTNDLGLQGVPLFELVSNGNALLPDTVDHMAFYAETHGFRTILTRDVPSLTKQAVKPMFQALLPQYVDKVGLRALTADDFDWSLHPGGEAIIEGVKGIMGLREEQLRASREIYRTRGNSSSPTVLIVLDKLRSMGRGRDHVVATSFGPGLAVEMALLRRCRGDEEGG